MKPTLSAKRSKPLDEDELRQLNDLSFTSVIAEIANSEVRPQKDPGRSRLVIDLESTHTDRTINELLASDFASGNPGSEPEPSVASGGAPEPEASDATQEMIAADLLFPELHLKR
jgi:hypothetical protein